MNSNKLFRPLSKIVAPMALAASTFAFSGQALAQQPKPVTQQCQAAAKETCNCPPKAAVHHRAQVVKRSVAAARPAAAEPAAQPAAVATPQPLPPIVVQVQAPAPQIVPVSAPQQAGLQPVIYDATKPIVLPSATQAGKMSEADQKFVDESDCNYKGFWNALSHPVNAQCKSNSVSSTSTIAGVVGVNGQGQAVFAATGQAVLSNTRSSSGNHGQGWLIPASVAIGTAVSTYVGIEGINIARANLHATQNLDASISNGISNGKFNSLFGSLNCGNASASGSSVSGGVNASCNIGNVAVNSALGNGGVVSAVGTTTSITAKLFSGASRPSGTTVTATGVTP